MAWKNAIRYEFPQTAEWFEEIYATNIDDLEPSPAAAVEFRFRIYKSAKTHEIYGMPGLRLANVDKEYKIECKPELSMKPGDTIRFEQNDNMKYKIVDIDYIIDSRNKHEYIYTANNWPGKTFESKIMVITLK